MPVMKRLKERWGVGPWGVVVILVVFSLTGFTVVWLKTPILDLLLPAAVVAVEWADRLPEALPGDRLELGIEREAEDQGSRSFTANATGEGSSEVLAAWRRTLEQVPGVSVERAGRRVDKERRR